jgi:hypothetical protein
MPKFKFKNSVTASAVPANGSLTRGELAVNIADKKAWIGDASLNPSKIIGTIANQDSNAVSITGGTVSVSSWNTSAATVLTATIGGTAITEFGATAGTGSKLMSSGGAKFIADDALKTRLKGIYTYASSGTFTYTKSGADVSKLHVLVCGGGGGARAYSEGGGGGGFSEKVIDATGISTVTVTVGGGGAGGAYFGFSGDGGTSSFGGYCSAGGGYGSSRNSQHCGGHGGNGSGGDINTYGGMGSSHNNMDQYSGSCASGGIGGGTYFGGCMAGDRPNWSISEVGAPGTGGNAISPDHNGQGGRTGRAGVVIVYEYR